MTENNPSQFIIYQSEDGKIKLDVRFVDETVWLTQALMAELFQTSSDNIGLHLKHIFTESELDENSTTEDFSVVRQEGSRQVKRSLKHYNLDAIISVGYRVQSHTATRFRQWATQTLKQYITQGYTLNQYLMDETSTTDPTPSFLRKRLCQKPYRLRWRKTQPPKSPLSGGLVLANSPLIRGARGVKNDERWVFAVSFAEMTGMVLQLLQKAKSRRKTLAGLCVLLDSCFRRNDERWVFAVSFAGMTSMVQLLQKAKR